MKAKYLHSSSFLHYKIKPSDSPVWKSVVRSKELLIVGIVWKIDSGQSISFWFDNWIGPSCLSTLLRWPPDSFPWPEARVSDFILSD